MTCSDVSCFVQRSSDFLPGTSRPSRLPLLMASRPKPPWMPKRLPQKPLHARRRGDPDELGILVSWRTLGKADAKSKASKFGNDIVHYASINWTYWMQKKLVVSVSKYLADFQRRVFGSRNCAIFLTGPAWLHIKGETMWDRETFQKDQQNGSAAT